MKGIIDQPESEALIEAYVEGSITDQESVRLKALLTQQPETVQLILEGLRDELFIRAVLAELPATRSAGVPAQRRRIPASSPLLQFLAPLFQLNLRRALAVGAGTCVVLALFLLVWCFGPVTGQPVLTNLEGDGISLERAGQLAVATPGTRLEPGDVLRTSTGSTVLISYAPEASRLTVRPNTELTLGTFSNGKRFQLGFGQIEASVARQRTFRPMIVKTPQAEARVVGTRFMLVATNNLTRLAVAEGKVRVTRLVDGATLQVASGHYAVAATNYELAAQPETGSILREYWTNLVGNIKQTPLESNPNYPDRPSGREYLTRLEVATNWGENFGDRIYGYLHPPKTGKYAFFLSDDDASCILLSRDEKPENKTNIAYSEGTAPGKWATTSHQSLTLVAGKRYYIEVMRRTGTGPNHLAVAWQPPGGQLEVISGEFLSPFKPMPKEKKP